MQNLFAKSIPTLRSDETSEEDRAKVLKSIFNDRMISYVRPMISLENYPFMSFEQMQDCSSALNEVLIPQINFKFKPRYASTKEAFQEEAKSKLDHIVSRYKLKSSVLRTHLVEKKENAPEKPILYFNDIRKGLPSKIVKYNECDDLMLILNSRSFAFWLNPESLEVRIFLDASNNQIKRLDDVFDYMYMDVPPIPPVLKSVIDSIERKPNP